MPDKADLFTVEGVQGRISVSGNPPGQETYRVKILQGANVLFNQLITVQAGQQTQFVPPGAALLLPGTYSLSLTQTAPTENFEHTYDDLEVT